MNKWLPLVLMAAALLAGAGLRAATVFSKPVFYHDESHTYQAATGHVGEVAGIIYDHHPPYAQWVPASEWKRMLRPQERFAFAHIGRDALAYDVHPPLYYFVLHLFCLAFGTHPWTGTLLNATLDVGTLFALYAFASRATGDRTAAAAAAFVWFTTAAALQVAVVEARMYSLLTLLAVLFADQVHRYVYAEGKAGHGRLAGLAALAAAGGLTHHHFGLVAAAAVGLCVLGRLRTPGGWRRPAAVVGAVVVGYAALVAVHPVFFGTGYKHLSDARWPDAAGVGARTKQAGEALAQFLIERRFGSELPAGVIWALAAVVPAILLAAAWRAWRLRRREGMPVPPAAAYAVALGVWLVGVTVALYVCGASPLHAMSYRYLAMGWPFVAVGVGLLLTPGRPGLTRARAAAVLTTCALAAATGTFAARMQWRDLESHPNAARAADLVRTADRVVIDNVGRGHWPRPMWRLREDALVVVALPNDLLRTTNPWRKDLRPGTVYISPAKSSGRTREIIVESFGRQFEVEFVGHLHSAGDVYLIGVRKVRAAPTTKRAPPATRPTTRPTSAGGT